MNKILIFGAGNNAKNIIKYIDKRKNKILYFVDNDHAKQGKCCWGVEIISPSMIADLEYDYILIASLYWKEIREQLKSLGVNRKKSGVQWHQ